MLYYSVTHSFVASTKHQVTFGQPFFSKPLLMYTPANLVTVNPDQNMKNNSVHS
jgi:hypothetical protein